MATYHLHLFCALFALTPIERGVVDGAHGVWFRDRDMNRFFRSDADVESCVARMQAEMADQEAALAV